MTVTGIPTQLKRMEDVVRLMRVLREDASRTDSEKLYCYGVQPSSFPYGIWFRGEGAHEPPLVPSVFRRRNRRNHLREPSLSNHIQSRVCDLYQVSNAFDRLCLAQHYEIPTRLLDWSESLLTAVYFACVSGGDNGRETDSYVFVLNAFALNLPAGQGIGRGRIHTPDDFGTLFRAHMAFSFSASDWIGRISNYCPHFSWQKLKDEDDIYRERYKGIDPTSGKQCTYYKTPVAVVPARTNHRMIIQSSVFTLHGGSLSWPAEDKCQPQGIPAVCCGPAGTDVRVYTRVCVPQDAKATLRKELFDFGMSYCQELCMTS